MVTRGESPLSIAQPTIAELRKHPGIKRKIIAARITVNSTDDSKIGNAILTLREAILIANGTLNVPALTVAEQAQINGTVVLRPIAIRSLLISGRSVLSN
jgi:hypothetical protein